MHRRSFLAKGIIASGAMATGSAAMAETKPEQKIKILGISCSPRKGKTTATSVKVALESTLLKKLASV